MQGQYKWNGFSSSSGNSVKLCCPLLSMESSTGPF